jgi:putative inorganic carbon (HCO3(-)) transporter
VSAPTLVPFAVAGVFEAIGVLLAGGAAAAALVVRDPRRRAIATLAAPVLAALALVTVLHHGTLDELRSRAALAGGAAVAGLVALAALTMLFRKRPALLPVLAVAVLPFRVPVVVGASTANLLLPLYGVIGAGCLAYAWTWLRGGAPAATPTDRDPWVRRLELALAGTLVLYCVQTLYSHDVAQATKNVCFFYVPFAVLFRLLLDTPWSPRRLRWAFGVTVGLALLFALIGFAEFATGRLLLTNTKVLEANELKPYFRVNSLFFDPNIYGRYLALTMVLLGAVLLWTRRGRDAALIGGALAVLWAGLVLSLSQSSFAALLAGLAALAVLRWRGRIVIAIATAGLCAAVAVVVFAPGLLHIETSGKNVWDRATSGRVELVNGAVDMFRERPVLGYGSGAFQAVYREQRHVRSTKVAAVSHTIPLTIAAEQGLAGLLVYAWLLLTAGALLFGGRLRAQVRRPSPGIGPIARAAVAAATCALVLHTLIYASFLEDPLLWTLLAIGAALRAESDAVEPGRRSSARPGAALA